MEVRKAHGAAIPLAMMHSITAFGPNTTLEVSRRADHQVFQLS